MLSVKNTGNAPVTVAIGPTGTSCSLGSYGSANLASLSSGGIFSTTGVPSLLNVGTDSIQSSWDTDEAADRLFSKTLESRAKAILRSIVNDFLHDELSLHGMPSIQKRNWSDVQETLAILAEREYMGYLKDIYDEILPLCRSIPGTLSYLYQQVSGARGYYVSFNPVEQATRSWNSIQEDLSKINIYEEVLAGRAGRPSVISIAMAKRPYTI